MNWYAAYTKVRAELWARTNLWERGFEVYLPQYLKRRRHARRTDNVAAPLFPRYLFVRADLEDGARRRIITAPGVAYLVSFGDRPAVVDNRIVAEIRGREDKSNLVRVNDGLRPGDPVRLVYGALCDRMGLFDCATDGDRIIVLLNLLGRAVRVHLPSAAIAREF